MADPTPLVPSPSCSIMTEFDRLCTEDDIRRDDIFRYAYCLLTAWGIASEPGGTRYKEILQEWRDKERPLDVQRFIQERFPQEPIIKVVL